DRCRSTDDHSRELRASEELAHETPPRTRRAGTSAAPARDAERKRDPRGHRPLAGTAARNRARCRYRRGPQNRGRALAPPREFLQVAGRSALRAPPVKRGLIASSADRAARPGSKFPADPPPLSLPRARRRTAP